MTFSRAILPVVVAAFAAGCSFLAPTPTPTSTLTPTRTPPPTTTPTITPLPPGPTRPPTSTSTPTIAPTPTPTRPPTLTPTPTITRPPTQTPLPSGRSGRVETKFRSAILGLEQPILIYLPPGYYDSQRRYPVMYMLHGYGGPYNEWEKWGMLNYIEPMIRDGRVQPLIVVMPSGFTPEGVPSYFFNHAPAAGGRRWGDYIWQDVVNYVDANYRTLPRRESRAIGGLSLGGQGALSLALLHPEVFRVVGAHSPSFRGPGGTVYPPDPFFGDWAHYNQYDPFWLAQNTDAARQLVIWIDVGLDDDKWRRCAPDQRCIESFHALLVAKNIPHDYQDDWSGTHEGSYWSPHIPDYLRWYSSKLVGQ